jgi:hypothetical protein
MAHRFLNKQLLLRVSSNTLITSHGTSWGTYWRRTVYITALWLCFCSAPVPLDREAEIKLRTESLCDRRRASHRLSSYPQADDVWLRVEAR